jgi:hypothetical protein
MLSWQTGPAYTSRAWPELGSEPLPVWSHSYSSTRSPANGNDVMASNS